jgi:hypothetical protein
MKNNIKNIIVVLLMSLTFVSCSDFLEEDPPQFISTVNFYKTPEDARNAVDAVYKSLNQVCARYWMTIDLYTDDIVSKNAARLYNVMATHDVHPSLVLFDKDREVYSRWWEGIGVANNVIDNVSPMDIDEDEKNLIVGEAKALRAFYYYNLVRAFGDVPMVNTSISTEADFMKQRSSVEDIYDEIIIPDLLFASEHCFDGLHDGHITKWTAKLILSEVYLTRAGTRRTSQGEFVTGVVGVDYFDLAKVLAKEVVDFAPNSLNTSASDRAPACGTAWDKETPFTNESMLEISYISVLGFGNWMSRESRGAIFGTDYWGGNNDKPLSDEGNDTTVRNLAFARSTAQGIFLPTPHLYDAYEDGDERRDFNILTRYDDVDGTTFLSQPMFRKFMDIDFLRQVEGTHFQYANNNTILYRFADALLIYAEAQNEADGAPNTDAYAAVNAIRNRAGLADLTSSLSQAEFRQAIYNERRCEFAGEYKRKFDLIRTNRLTNSTTNVNLTWTADQGSVKDFRNAYVEFSGAILWPDNEWLWPIPQAELELNLENDWIQNEGY